MTYQERVAKMAFSLNAAGACYAPYKQIHDQFHVGSAAIHAVAAQAEAIREVLTQMFEDEYLSDSIRDENTLDHIIHVYQRQHGYIEPKTEDDGRHT